MGCRKIAVVPLAGLVVSLACGLAWGQVAVQLKGDQLTWQVKGKQLGATSRWLQVWDLAAGDKFVPVPVTATGSKFHGTAAELNFEGEWKPNGEAMELACRVVADPPRDRAIIVRVALPLEAKGWQWWDDIAAPRLIEAGKHYDHLIRWGGLRDVSAYPCCAVTGLQSRPPQGGGAPFGRLRAKQAPALQRH